MIISSVTPPTGGSTALMTGPTRAVDLDVELDTLDDLSPCNMARGICISTVAHPSGNGYRQIF